MSAITYNSSEYFRTKYKLVSIHDSKVHVLFIHSIIKFSKEKNNKKKKKLSENFIWGILTQGESNK